MSESKINESDKLNLINLPIDELYSLGVREGRRPRPIYNAHKWFARRFGSEFRALLIAAFMEPDSSFWDVYYKGIDLSKVTILDPFVGGGTSLFEAQRLGANIIGIDIDPVACVITDFELDAAMMPDIKEVIERFKKDHYGTIDHLYKTITPEGEYREVLHYFWVQVVNCRECGMEIEAHPHYMLGFEAEGEKQWVFCPECHNIYETQKNEKQLICTTCNKNIAIERGPVNNGSISCPKCGRNERLIDVQKRTGLKPQWRLFATETIEPSKYNSRIPMMHRKFRPASLFDHETFLKAKEMLENRKTKKEGILYVPTDRIPSGCSDDRLSKYGYEKYSELFNSRQLLHLSLLAESIQNLTGDLKRAMALAFSNHLTTNCMLTNYAFGWRRIAPLFSVKGYRHVTRPVEINPWIDGTGRGTFINSAKKIQKAIEYARSPSELKIEGGTIPSPSLEFGLKTIINGDSRTLNEVANNSIDLVLTDPPYFDNIAYSELAAFFMPWQKMFALINPDMKLTKAINNNIAVRNRSAQAGKIFQHSLTECFHEIFRVLKDKGRLVFTFQHNTAVAWNALAHSLAKAGFEPLQVFPMLGEGSTAVHSSEGSIKWDAVFVMRKQTPLKRTPRLVVDKSSLQSAEKIYSYWVGKLQDIFYREADLRNFKRACLVAEALIYKTNKKSKEGAYLTDVLSEQ